MDKNLENIVEIFETVDREHVNACLKLGYKLLNTGVHYDPPEQIVYYSLGRTSDVKKFAPPPQYREL